MKILLIDAYDSFVYVIYQYLLSLDCEVDVVRNDKIVLKTIQEQDYDALVLGPGPGHPKAAGYLELLAALEQHLPIFGVCLGMQAISLYYGGAVVGAKHLMHGKTCTISHHNSGCFTGIANPLTVTRYHSLITTEDSLINTPLHITARADDDGYIMGIKHPHLPIEGVQFHPESILTENGLQLFKNFLRHVEHAQL